MKDNALTRYTSGERSGEPMYNYNVTVSADQISFAGEAPAETPAPAAPAARPTNQSSAGSTDRRPLRPHQATTTRAGCNENTERCQLR